MFRNGFTIPKNMISHTNIIKKSKKMTEIQELGNKSSFECHKSFLGGGLYTKNNNNIAKISSEMDFPSPKT